MGNVVKGEVTFLDGDVTYTLLFDINTLCTLEAALGLNSIAELELGEGMSTRTLRTVFWAGLIEHHPDLTEIAAGKILTRISSGEALSKVMQAVAAAFPEAANAPADPRMQAVGPGTGKSSTASGSSSAAKAKRSGDKRRGS